MNAHLKAKLIADINALDGSEPLSELLVLAKACQPWLSEFTTQELAPLTNRVNSELAKTDNDSNTDDLLIASKILEAIDIASQPARSSIKNIYRGVYNGSADSEGTITIPEVVPEKTTVKILIAVTAFGIAGNSSSSRGGASWVYAYLKNATTLGVRNKIYTALYAYREIKTANTHIPIHWEVIEYA